MELSKIDNDHIDGVIRHAQGMRLERVDTFRLKQLKAIADDINKECLVRQDQPRDEALLSSTVETEDWFGAIYDVTASPVAPPTPFVPHLTVDAEAWFEHMYDVTASPVAPPPPTPVALSFVEELEASFEAEMVELHKRGKP
jgi:hypothetical protein